MGTKLISASALASFLIGSAFTAIFAIFADHQLAKADFGNAGQRDSWSGSPRQKLAEELFAASGDLDEVVRQLSSVSRLEISGINQASN